MGFTKAGKKAGNTGLSLLSLEPKPCPGISESDNARVGTYLKRTAAPGGSGHALGDIAKEMFNKFFSKLSKKKQNEVLNAQLHGHQWKNDHQRLRVFSTSCQKVTPNLPPNRPLPCKSCHKILTSKAFRVAIAKPTPLPKNQIYTNKRFRIQCWVNFTAGSLDSKTSLKLKYVNAP